MLGRDTEIPKLALVASATLTLKMKWSVQSQALIEGLLWGSAGNYSAVVALVASEGNDCPIFSEVVWFFTNEDLALKTE